MLLMVFNLFRILLCSDYIYIVCTCTELEQIYPVISTTRLERHEAKKKSCEAGYLSIVPLLRWVADVWRVGQHVGPVDVIDGLGLWKGCQVLVVQHLLP